ncbi:MAG: glycosyltransferase family 4 protein [Conexivisphaerales archaeon]
MNNKNTIFIINYFYVWPVDNGGKYHLSRNIAYLVKNYENLRVLQGLGNQQEIPVDLKQNIQLCNGCNKARKKSEIFSFILFYLWAFKILIKNKHSTVITVGWNLTPLGVITKFIAKGRWINFIDDPLINMMSGRKASVKKIILRTFSKLSIFSDYTTLANKEEIKIFSSMFKIDTKKIKHIPPICVNENFDDNYAFSRQINGYEGKRIILFFGDMTYKHNEHAALYVLNELSPQIYENRKDVIFLIAGKGSERFKSTDACEFLGFRSDTELIELIRSSYLVIAPISEEFKSGMKTKVLRSISLGTPVLGTEAALYGLEREGLPAFSASLEDFPYHLLNLLERPEEVDKMRKIARRYIENFYSEKVLKIWDEIINIVD